MGIGEETPCEKISPTGTMAFLGTTETKLNYKNSNFAGQQRAQEIQKAQE